MASIIKYEDGTYRLTLSEDDFQALGVLLLSSSYEGDQETPHILTGAFYDEYVDARADQRWKYTTEEEGQDHTIVVDYYEEEEDEDEE